MNKIIPLLPAQNVKDTAKFYESIGFEITYLVTNPYPCAVVKFNELELQFYSHKKLDPATNDRMNYVLVEDVDAIYETFTTNYKKATGRVPRSGKPMFSKPRDLKDDRRFTMSDISGNYFYVGTPIQENLFRTIKSEEYAKNFGLAYDLLYSKLDLNAANNMMKKFFPADLLTLELSEIDLAKVLMLMIDLKFQTEQLVDEKLHSHLQSLFNLHNSSEWQKLKLRSKELFQK